MSGWPDPTAPWLANTDGADEGRPSDWQIDPLLAGVELEPTPAQPVRMLEVLDIGVDWSIVCYAGRLARTVDVGDVFVHHGRRYRLVRPWDRRRRIRLVVEPLTDDYLVDRDGVMHRPVASCGHVDEHDGTCAHPNALTPECFISTEGPSDCPVLAERWAR